MDPVVEPEETLVERLNAPGGGGGANVALTERPAVIDTVQGPVPGQEMPLPFQPEKL